MQALGTNPLSAVALDRAVLPGMLEQRSRRAIVHVSSLQWKRPHPSWRNGPAKAASTSYSKAEEFGPWAYQ